jgi:hypothetical protein
MTNPTLLVPFEDSLAARDQSGAITFTGVNTIAYTAGANSGTRAFVMGGNNYVFINGTAGRISHTTGAIAVRIKPHTTVPASNSYLFRVGATTTNAYITCYQATTTGNLTYFTRSAGVNTAVTSVPQRTTEVWTDLIFAWSSSLISVYDPSGLVVSQERTGTPSTTWDQDTIYLGNPSPGISADVDSFLFMDAPPTESERSRIFAASAWTWNVLNPAGATTVMNVGSSRIGPLRLGRS